MEMDIDAWWMGHSPKGCAVFFFLGDPIRSLRIAIESQKIEKKYENYEKESEDRCGKRNPDSNLGLSFSSQLSPRLVVPPADQPGPGQPAPTAVPSWRPSGRTTANW